MEIRSHEFVNKFVELGAFIDPVWRECTKLNNAFLFEIFVAFRVPVV